MDERLLTWGISGLTSETVRVNRSESSGQFPTPRPRRSMVGYPLAKSHVQEIHILIKNIFCNIREAIVCRSIINLSEHRDP